MGETPMTQHLRHGFSLRRPVMTTQTALCHGCVMGDVLTTQAQDGL